MVLAAGEGVEQVELTEPSAAVAPQPPPRRHTPPPEPDRASRAVVFRGPHAPVLTEIVGIT